MKLYTVREFAKEKRISRDTVRRWIRDGRIVGLIKDGKSYLIPEKNLSIKVNLGASRNKSRKNEVASIKTEAQAREAYSSMTTKDGLGRFAYDELWDMFYDKRMAFKDIALAVGVTKQRISQIYNIFFAFGVNGYERRKDITLERRQERELQETLDSEKISSLGAIVESMGLTVELVNIGKGPNFHRNMMIINGHLCRIHRSRKDTKFSGTTYRSYSRLLITRDLLDTYEFVIALAGEVERRVFIIPTGDLKRQFLKGEKRKLFYLPTSDKGAYRNIRPILDWLSYKDAWHLITGES
jgi:excisionase family DNA binding protein